MVRVGTGEHLDFEKTVKEKIRKIEGVKTVYSVFGRYDLIAQVETLALEELSHIADKIRAIDGVLTTESLIVH